MKTECQQFYNENQVELPTMTEKALKASVKRKRKVSLELEETQVDDSLTNQHVDLRESMTVADIYERDCNDFNEDRIKETFRQANVSDRMAIKKKYSIDFKIKAIDDVEAETRNGNTEDPSISKVSKDLEISKNLLCKWWTNKDKIRKVYQLNLKKSKLEHGLESAVSNNLHFTIDNLLSEGAHGTSPVSGSGKKRPRGFCKTCPGCITPDCGECKNCKDKPKFNGPNKIRQRCIWKPPCQKKDKRQSILSKTSESNTDDQISNQQENASDVPELTTHNAANMQPEPQMEYETNGAEEKFEVAQEASEWLDNVNPSYNYLQNEDPEREVPVEEKSSESEAECSSESEDQLNVNTEKQIDIKNEIISQIEEEVAEINEDIDVDHLGEINETSEPVFSEEKTNISTPVVASGKKKTVACKTCPGCVAPQCGECKYCLDMPKFGGKGKMRQRCVLKACKDIQPRKRLSSKSKGPKKPLQSKSKSNSTLEVTPEDSDIAGTPEPDKLNATKVEVCELTDDNVRSSLKSESPKTSQHWWNSVPQLDEKTKDQEHDQNIITNNLQEKIETNMSESIKTVNTDNPVDTPTENQIEHNYGASEELKLSGLGQENHMSVSNNVSPFNFPMHLPPGLQIIPKKRNLNQGTEQFPSTNEEGFNVRSRNHPSVNNDIVTIEKVIKRSEPQPPVIKWKQETSYFEAEQVPSSAWPSGQYPHVASVQSVQSVQAHYQPGFPAAWPASPVPGGHGSSHQMWPGHYYSSQQQFQNFNYQNINYDGQPSGQTFTPSSDNFIKTEPPQAPQTLSDSNTIPSQHPNDSVELEEYINNDDVLNILDSKKSLQPAVNNIKQEVLENSNVTDISPYTVKMEQMNSQSVIDYSQPSRRVVTMFPMHLPQPTGLGPQDDKLFTISRSQIELFRSMSKLVVKNEMTLKDAAIESGINKKYLQKMIVLEVTN